MVNNYNTLLYKISTQICIISLFKTTFGTWMYLQMLRIQLIRSLGYKKKIKNPKLGKHLAGSYASTVSWVI